MAGGENTSGLFLCPVLGGRYALGGVHSTISMTPFKFADYQEFERRKGYDESIHLENNSPQEWEEISFSAFSKARRNGCFTGRFLLKQSKCSVMKMTALSWNVLAKILKIPTGGPPQPLSPGT